MLPNYTTKTGSAIIIAVLLGEWLPFWYNKRMIARSRAWLNQNIAIPLVGLLRGWFLNVWIADLPIAPLRLAYYRHFCKIKIGTSSNIWRGARFTGDSFDKITIGAGCSIAFDSFWVAGAAITLGDAVVFGHHVQLYTSDHDPDAPDFARRDAPIVIGDHAWIGSRALILPGVTIGAGAVVAAGSIVTKDVPPYTIVAGQPAKVLRERGTRQFTYQITKSPWYV